MNGFDFLPFDPVNLNVNLIRFGSNTVLLQEE